MTHKMNLTFHSLIIASGLMAPCLLMASVDLANLENYANQAVPSYITEDNTPNDNPITDAGATLGRILFYDKRLSTDDTVSCSTCHQQTHAFSDPDALSQGVNGLTGRHSMRLINARFAREDNFFWDERADTLEIQTTKPIQDHNEMGWSGTDDDPSFADLITKLEAEAYYRLLFAYTFGDEEITEERVQLAIAQFIRSIQSFDSKYDIGRAQVNNDNDDFPNFTTAENNGKDLFINRPNFINGSRTGGGFGCNACHTAPEFDIDPNSANNGIVTNFDGSTDTSVTRSPTLRDMFDSSGNEHTLFMHTGTGTGTADIEAVLAHYDDISPVTGLDNRLAGGPGGSGQQLNMTQSEIDDIIAFMKTLTGSDVYTNEKWSDPFDAEGDIELIAPHAITEFVAVTDDILTLSFEGVRSLSYTVQYKENLTDDWATYTIITADSDGQCSCDIAMDVAQCFFRVIYD